MYKTACIPDFLKRIDLNFFVVELTGVYPGFTQMEWYSKVYPSLTEDNAPMECVQEAGEILYLVNTGNRLYKLSTVNKLLFGWEKFL